MSINTVRFLGYSQMKVTLIFCLIASRHKKYIIIYNYNEMGDTKTNKYISIKNIDSNIKI